VFADFDGRFAMCAIDALGIAGRGAACASLG
jgi:hypothetical protein